MPVNDELLDQWREDHDDLIGDLASALGTAVGADDSDEANDYVTDLTNAVVPIVRSALAAQPQPLFEGVVKTTMPSSLHMDGTSPVTLAAWADTETLRRVKGQRVVVCPAVAGSVTPGAEVVRAAADRLDELANNAPMADHGYARRVANIAWDLRRASAGSVTIPDADKLDYQYGKTLDVWSLALWLGAALQALKERAEQGDPDAILWLKRVPDEVKAQWPGVFPTAAAGSATPTLENDDG